MTRDITSRAVTTAVATSGAWAAARLTGRAKRARTVALAALVGAQLGQTVAIGAISPAVLASSAGSALVLAGIVQTPGVSQLFGCTPLGPVGWAIAGTATAAAVTALLPPVLSRIPLPGTGEVPSAAVHPQVTDPTAQPRLVATVRS